MLAFSRRETRFAISGEERPTVSRKLLHQLLHVSQETRFFMLNEKRPLVSNVDFFFAREKKRSRNPLMLALSRRETKFACNNS